MGEKSFVWGDRTAEAAATWSGSPERGDREVRRKLSARPCARYGRICSHKAREAGKGLGGSRAQRLRTSTRLGESVLCRQHAI